MKYNEFILSDRWNEIRKIKLERQPYCEKCWCCTNLNIHHSHYKAMYWNEKMKSLYVLCKDCHKDFHSIHWVSDNMVFETRDFLWYKQSYYRVSKDIIDYIINWWRFENQKYTKSKKTRRAVKKHIRKWYSEINFI